RRTPLFDTACVIARIRGLEKTLLHPPELVLHIDGCASKRWRKPILKPVASPRAKANERGRSNPAHERHDISSRTSAVPDCLFEELVRAPSQNEAQPDRENPPQAIS